MGILARSFWIFAGFLCLGLGALGSILPLLPTTVFILMSAFAFSRSSPKLHRWLIQHRYFGPLIKNWQQHGAISRPVKALSVSVMIATPLLSWLLGVPLWVLVLQAVVLFSVSLFVITRPDAPADLDHSA